MGKRSLLMLAAASAAAAQSPLTVVAGAGNKYAGLQLDGHHVGAAMDWETVGGATGGDRFLVNGSLLNPASPRRLINYDVVSGQPLTCGVAHSDSLSSNGGVLVCGAGGGDPPNSGDAILGTQYANFAGIAGWYVCTAQNPTYGAIADTVVGSYGGGDPSGPGISNCVAITGLTFASNAGPTGSVTSQAPYPTNGTVPIVIPIVTVTITRKACPVCEEEVIVTSCPENQPPCYKAKPTNAPPSPPPPPPQPPVVYAVPPPPPPAQPPVACAAPPPPAVNAVPPPPYPPPVAPAAPAVPVAPVYPISPNHCPSSGCPSSGNGTSPAIKPFTGAANDLSSSRFGAIALAAGSIIGAMLL